jgi:predicted nucleic acid-binding protein
VIHLDTGFLIRALARGSAEDRRLRAWLVQGVPVGLSVVSWAEFLCGPVAGEHVALAVRVVGEPVSYTPADAAETARLFNLGGRRRGSFTDCMIAAVALRAGASVATTNPADFDRFAAAGLEILGPEGPW